MYLMSALYVLSARGLQRAHRKTEVSHTRQLTSRTQSFEKLNICKGNDF